MYLKSNTVVVPTADHDYPEWHKGRTDYALWYLEILDDELIAYLTELREQFADVLYRPNTRQFHITIFICGFLVDIQRLHQDDFTQKQFKQHIQDLSQAMLPKFSLRTGQINSFESALFLEIQDDHQVLKAIRSILAQSSIEIAPLDYCPHITLGLYKDSVNSNEILRRIDAFNQRSFKVDVKHLSFGTYQAQELQGPLLTHYQHILGNTTCCN